MGRSLPPPKGRGSADAQAILTTHRDNPATAGCAFLGADMAEDEAAPQQDPTTGRFLPGNSGFGGKPKGARTKLGEQFLSALQQDFEVHGVEAITKVRTERPQDYVKVIASLMPRDLNLNINNLDDATDDELVQRLRDLEATIRPFLGVEGSGDTGNGTGPQTAH